MKRIYDVDDISDKLKQVSLLSFSSNKKTKYDLMLHNSFRCIDDDPNVLDVYKFGQVMYTKYNDMRKQIDTLIDIIKVLEKDVAKLKNQNDWTSTYIS